MTDIEFIVISSDGSDQQPVTQITREEEEEEPASRAYTQDYYMKPKGAYICEHRERIYTCKSSLNKRQGRSILRNA